VDEILWCDHSNETSSAVLSHYENLCPQEMQQVAPPLTGIHTPNKGGNSIFAFGPRNVSQESTVLRKLSGMITVIKAQFLPENRPK